MSSDPKKTCTDGKRCTLDVGHKGACVEQRMPKPAEYDDPEPFGAEAEINWAKKKGSNRWQD